MPYDIFRVNGEHCVYKVDDSGNRTGEALGCHGSQSEAEDQATAIRIQEHSKSMVEPTDTTPLYSSTPVVANLSVKEMDDGRMRWIASYSNNIRDRDNPPEILSAESHRRVVYMTDKGIVPYPELWVWHEKSWSIGTVDWLAVDEHEGFVFALASGFIKEEAREFAKSIAEKDVALSHGMYPLSIERADDDPSIITGYIDHEITLLPRFAAANPLTAFAGELKESGESKMAVKDEKREKLEKEWPGASGPLSQVEEANRNAKDVAETVGLETKETDEETEPDTTEETAPEKEAEAREDSPEGGEEAPEKATTDESELRAEIVDALKALNDRLTGIEQSIATNKQETEKQISEIRKSVTDSEKREKQRNEAPMSATLASLIAGKSATSAKETEVRDTDKNMDGPEETKDTRGNGLFFEEFIGA